MKVLVNKSRKKIEERPSLLLSSDSITSFFNQEINTYLSTQGIKLDDFTISYIVKLLSEYALAESFHNEDKTQVESLAMLYLKSQQTELFEERVRLLKRLGDVSLYVSGFFADSLNRKIVDVDYYIKMGGNAYGSLSNLFENKPNAEIFSNLYGDLARKFSLLVELLNTISETGSVQNQSTLRLYERWLKTKSERIYKILCQKGVIPNHSIKVDYH